ncbi:hypothetical protein Hdeb2414_s0015g00452911 [Helianthus debilis subsp. tardiflorus]
MKKLTRLFALTVHFGPFLTPLLFGRDANKPRKYFEYILDVNKPSLGHFVLYVQISSSACGFLCILKNSPIL